MPPVLTIESDDIAALDRLQAAYADMRAEIGRIIIGQDQVIEELKQRGIGTSVHFIPLHTHPYYRKRWGYGPGDFPVADNYFDRCLSLPLYPAMSDEDADNVIEALTDIAIRFRR